ncbi:MAG: hypothetical protein R3E91_03920 [Chlamydiales bacterium]
MKSYKFLTFLNKHSFKLLFLFLIAISLFFWRERVLNRDTMQSQHDFMIANKIFESFQKGELPSPESIEKIETLLKDHPEVYPKYNTMLAMSYLAQNAPKGAFYIKTILETPIAGNLPQFYHAYGKTSLLIAEKKYSEAYMEAQALSAAIKNEEDYSTLYAINLLRIVSLEMQIDKSSKAWRELKSHPVYGLISSIFQEGHLSLEDWHLLCLKN